MKLLLHYLTKINCLLTNSYDVSFNNIFQLELLEMGFKRIFFQYLLWTHAYNNAVSDANKAKKMDRSTVSITDRLWTTIQKEFGIYDRLRSAFELKWASTSSNRHPLTSLSHIDVLSKFSNHYCQMYC